MAGVRERLRAGGRSWAGRTAGSAGVRAAAFFAVLALAFLARPIATGGWYLPADVTQGVAGLRTAPAGADVRAQNGIETDPATQMDPWWHFDRDELQAGRLPTWNPDDGLGTPQLANYQSAVLSPYSLPFYLLPLRAAFLARAFLVLWSLSFFTWLFLRRSRIGAAGALMGGVVYGYGGYHLLWLDWQHPGAAIVLPAGAWAVRCALQAPTPRARRRGLAAVAAAVGAGLLAGHPETFLWCALVLGVVTLGALAVDLHTWRLRLLRAAQLAGAAALGVLLAAAQLLPFEEYLHLSTTYATRSGSGIGGGTGTAGLDLLGFPDVLGSPATGYLEHTYPLGNYSEANGQYVGLVALLLAAVGLIALIHRRGARPLAALGLVTAGAGALLFHSVRVVDRVVQTPLLKLSTVNRSHDVWIWGVALLAAAGTDLIIGSARSAAGLIGPVRRWSPVAAAVAGAALLGVVAYAGSRKLRSGQRGSVGATLDTPLARHLTAQHVAWLVGCLAVGAAAAAALLAVRGGHRRAAAGLVGVLLAAQFGSTGLLLQGFNASVPTDRVYPTPPGLAAALAFTGRDTVLHADNTFIPADANLWYRAPGLTTYDALGVRWYDALFARVMGVTDAYFRSEGVPTCLASLRLLGVSWVYSRYAVPLRPGTHVPLVTTVPGPDLAQLRQVQVFGTTRVFAVPGSGGRFSVVPATSVASGEPAALATVADCGFDANASAVLLPAGSGPGASTQLAGSTATTPPGPAQPVGVLAEDPTHLRLAVPAGNGGELVVRQTWFPGWEATVDGRAVPIDRVDTAFRGVRLPPGAHTVTMSYRPASLRRGALLSAAGVLGLVALLATPPAALRRRLAWRRGPRSRGTAGDGTGLPG